MEGSPLIRELAVGALGLWLISAAHAQVPAEVPAEDPAEAPIEVSDEVPAADPAPDHVQDDALERHRTAFNALAERAVGQTSRAVRFDWRRSAVQVAVLGGLPAELNNFDTLRGGLAIRWPGDELLFALSLAWASVSSSESTDQLALTPYRQPGRPSRLELDFDVGFPLAEGAATAFMGWIPAVEVVFSAVARLRYLIYPGGWSGLGLRRTLGAIVDPSLTGRERDNLESDRLPGMKLDAGRYGLMGGLSTDVYFQSGLFFTTQMMLAVPLLDGLTDTELPYGFELDVWLGYAL